MCGDVGEFESFAVTGEVEGVGAGDVAHAQALDADVAWLVGFRIGISSEDEFGFGSAGGFEDAVCERECCAAGCIFFVSVVYFGDFDVEGIAEHACHHGADGIEYGDAHAGVGGLEDGDFEGGLVDGAVVCGRETCGADDDGEFSMMADREPVASAFGFGKIDEDVRHGFEVHFGGEWHAEMSEAGDFACVATEVWIMGVRKGVDDADIGHFACEREDALAHASTRACDGDMKLAGHRHWSLPRVGG